MTTDPMARMSAPMTWLCRVLAWMVSIPLALFFIAVFANAAFWFAATVVGGFGVMIAGAVRLGMAIL